MFEPLTQHEKEELIDEKIRMNLMESEMQEDEEYQESLKDPANKGFVPQEDL